MNLKKDREKTEEKVMRQKKKLTKMFHKVQWKRATISDTVNSIILIYNIDASYADTILHFRIMILSSILLPTSLRFGILYCFYIGQLSILS